MRLLLVTNDYPPKPGGIQQYLANLVSGYDGPVRVLAPQDAGVTDDARVVRHQRTFMWPTRAVRRWVEEHIEEFRPDVVLFGAPHPLALLGPGLTKRTGIPFAVMTHGAEVTFPIAVPGLRQLLKRPLREAATVFAVSDFTAARVVKLTGRAVITLGAGVDVEAYHPGPSVSKGRLTVGCVSRFVPRKGHTRVIDAADRLAASGREVDVLIVGRGRLERRLRARARRASVQVRFEVGVPWERLPQLYREMDVFCMPARSRWLGLEVEGLGIVYLEAAASGLPVIAGTSGGSPETVEPGRTGFVATSRADCAEALSILVDDPELRATMGYRGRRMVERRFTWPIVQQRFEEGLRRAAFGPSPR